MCRRDFDTSLRRRRLRFVRYRGWGQEAAALGEEEQMHKGVAQAEDETYSSSFRNAECGLRIASARIPQSAIRIPKRRGTGSGFGFCFRLSLLLRRRSFLIHFRLIILVVHVRDVHPRMAHLIDGA